MRNKIFNFFKLSYMVIMVYIIFSYLLPFNLHFRVGNKSDVEIFIIGLQIFPVYLFIKYLLNRSKDNLIRLIIYIIILIYILILIGIVGWIVSLNTHVYEYELDNPLGKEMYVVHEKSNRSINNYELWYKNTPLTTVDTGINVYENDGYTVTYDWDGYYLAIKYGGHVDTYNMEKYK